MELKEAMAEAHSIAALSVSLTHDGISISYDQELLNEIMHSFFRAYKKRVARFKNNFYNGIFPANAYTMCIVIFVVSILSVSPYNFSFGILYLLRYYIFSSFFGDGIFSQAFSLVLYGIFVWFMIIQIIRLSLKCFLLYKGWMYENPHLQPISKISKLWLTVLHLLSKGGLMLHSFQGALPHLPLPRLNDTLDKHLCTMRPICTDKEYEELVQLTEEFRIGVGRHLQWYLIIKSFFSINYVSEWWEEFVYLRQRSPIMINSNYYGLDSIIAHPTRNQAARAATVTWAALLFRRMIERQEIKPFSFLPQYKIPFCTAQYERLFNSCRVPCLEKDIFCHWSDAKHIAVYCNGCWYRLAIHNGKRLYEPCELQKGFEAILNEKVSVDAEESCIAALTAGDRDLWAQARRNHFASGINQFSLHTIEKAAFVIILDEQEVFYDSNDPSKLDYWASSLLHGTGYDRWFDKSFNLIIFKNGRFGINAEHSWGDAAVVAHFMEFCTIKTLCEYNYDENGSTCGKVELIPKYDRLRWHITPELNVTIMKCLQTTRALIDDVEVAVLVWTKYGKGLIKKLHVSPDGFLQMVLQLAFYRNQGKFALTYEATTARLFREGRTETVRSCSSYSCDFVHAMLDPNQTHQERLRLLHAACRYHQTMYRDAMCGKGIDRHLFALYIVMRYLKFQSPFLERIFPPTFLLSTSQTPISQCGEELKYVNVDPHEFATAGGGFGPVADNGYGVSYIIVGDDILSFHISSKRSADNTSSARLRDDIAKSLEDMSLLLQ
ncbi:hypothetical protein LOAG_06041 [Loa loa]|uniref:carnitine O-palmitoyltransferase n=1 Tax=Loa loa TaxID=7209 RepID=A0A1I7W292_LOALO|nr:hypothetical protein LOAG_06041 [Loa loa]EFO22446.2 hypothetical protein LOAG_06041 [Loa loa]